MGMSFAGCIIICQIEGCIVCSFSISFHHSSFLFRNRITVQRAPTPPPPITERSGRMSKRTASHQITKEADHSDRETSDTEEGEGQKSTTEEIQKRVILQPRRRRTEGEQPPLYTLPCLQFTLPSFLITVDSPSFLITVYSPPFLIIVY